jgi:hypothetical protein
MRQSSAGTPPRLNGKLVHLRNLKNIYPDFTARAKAVKCSGRLHTVRRFFSSRCIRLLLLFAPLFLTLGCESDSSAPTRATAAPAPAMGKATPSANVSRLQAWKDAELIASLGPGRLEVIGTGDSMRPVYGEATILVISRVAFAELKPGMTVAYTTSRGSRVVHQLLTKDRLGWRIQGLNNAAEDKERVTPENLIGVVYASLAYDPNLK